MRHEYPSTRDFAAPPLLCDRQKIVRLEKQYAELFEYCENLEQRIECLEAHANQTPETPGNRYPSHVP